MITYPKPSFKINNLVSNSSDYLIFSLLIKETIKTISSKLHEAGNTKKCKNLKEA